MASRRRGGSSIDDLKARLGTPEEEPTPAPAAAPAGEASTVPSEAVTGEDGAPAATPAATPAAQPAAAKASPYLKVEAEKPPEPVDFATAVREVKEVDLSTDKSDSVPLTDAELAELGQVRRSPVGMIIGVAVAGVFGLVLGGMVTSTSAGRKLNNARLVQVQNVDTRVSAVSAEIGALSTRVNALEIEGFSEEFEGALRATFTDGQNGSIEPTLLASNSSIMGYNGGISTQLVSLVVKTESLRSLIDEHREVTGRQVTQLVRERDGVVDEAEGGSAIVFNFDEVLSHYREFDEDDTEGKVYAPPTVEKVTFDELTMSTTGSGDDERHVFSVNFRDGVARDVDVYNILMYDAESFAAAAPTGATVTEEYVERVSEIREQIGQVASALAAAEQELGSIGGE